MICRPTPELTWTMTPMHENRTLFHGGKGLYSTYDLLSDLLHLGRRSRCCFHLLNNPMLEQVILAKYCARMPAAQITTCVKSSALRPMRLCLQLLASSVPWVRRPCRCRQSSVRWMRRRTVAYALILAESDSDSAGAQRERQYMIPLIRKYREVSPGVAVGKPARHSDEVRRWCWC